MYITGSEIEVQMLDLHTWRIFRLLSFTSGNIIEYCTALEELQPAVFQTLEEKSCRYYKFEYGIWLGLV